ncbi:NIC-domain-containing protein [Amniculicola lignicola CBS 123094]|uniref:NIC-domain-containing protein n=1 Tax=Amniculicola lignicola CBS 123094 TaxID=1392246 RepID=A0A6A5WDV8_9PLEO|nr:NIC-domain-containing protein [Amniculicola lignicola CBS 123094]
MSLFSGLGGSNPPASGASSSLFGSRAGTAPAPTTAASGLFGGAAAPSSAPASNLFGGATTSSPGASTTPFGGAGGSNLFGGGLGVSSSAPTSTAPPATSGGLGGLFGASAAKTAAPASTGASGFAFPGTTPQSNRLSNLQQTVGGAQGSAFGASTAQQQAGGPLAQSTSNSARSAHFDHLLERGKKRNAGENGFGNFDELPSLQLGLGDIARKVRNLGSGGPSADQAQDRAAHFLLSASGVKIGSTLRDLNQFSTQAGLSTAGPSSNLLDTDVDGYISGMHSQSTLGLIQDGLEQAKRDFDSFLEDNIQQEWDAQRKRIYEHFGLGRQSEDMAASQSTFGSTATRGAFGRSTRKGRSVGVKGASTNGASFGKSGAPPVLGSVMSPYNKRSLIGQDSPEKSVTGGQVGPEDRFVRDKQEKFMEKVKDLNVTRLRETPYPVFHAFRSVEEQSGGEYTDNFINAYNALISISNEKEDPEQAMGTAPRERCYAKEYLDEVPNSANSVKTRKRILDGSRKFLEQKFLNEVENAVRKHARDAQVGGVPSMLNRIRGYIKVKLAYKELGTDIEDLQKIGADGDEYPWAIVFFLLRAGLVRDAARYVVIEMKNFFQNNDRNFQAAIEYYAQDPDRRLSTELQQKINHVYAQRARIAPTNDPYRMACYKVVGRCEMTRRSLEPLKESMDDWIWLQFNLAREGNRAEENAGELFGLEELRATISDIGQRHFMSGAADASGGYGVYFWLATLAGMFEQAINFLYQHNYVSAVHFAIALTYYGFLRVSDWSSAGMEILTYTTKQVPQLNFGRIVGHYTGDFRAARADAAAEYLILLCLNADLAGEAGKQQAGLCHEALRELVLETREFSTLLGDVKSNGEGTNGIIQERVPLIHLPSDQALIKVITHEAAKMADDNGRTNDAVLLNHLAGEYDSVVVILNRALAEALSVDLGHEPLRLEPLKQRISVASNAPSSNSDSSMSLLGTDDPMELAGRVASLYKNNALWYGKITQSSRETLDGLIQLNSAKKLVETKQFMMALDIIESLKILPLDAKGNLSLIRGSANTFSTFPSEIARNIGNVLLWSIWCCSTHRETLLNSRYEDPTRRALADQLLQKAKDLMVFAGLIRYKLPPRVFETLAIQGQDAGAY